MSPCPSSWHLPWWHMKTRKRKWKRTPPSRFSPLMKLMKGLQIYIRCLAQLAEHHSPNGSGLLNPFLWEGFYWTPSLPKVNAARQHRTLKLRQLEHPQVKHVAYQALRRIAWWISTLLNDRSYDKQLRHQRLCLIRRRKQLCCSASTLTYLLPTDIANTKTISLHQRSVPFAKSDHRLLNLVKECTYNLACRTPHMR